MNDAFKSLRRMENKDKPYAVFLSYNSEDYEAVEQIAVYLKEKAKLVPWFDCWDLIPGKSVLAHIEIGLTTSGACAVFVGKSGQGPWQNKEVEGVLRQQMNNPDVSVIPVLLPDVPEKPELPLFLQGNLWIDFRGKGLDDDDALWRLECGIRGIAPGPGRPKVSKTTDKKDLSALVKWKNVHHDMQELFCGLEQPFEILLKCQYLSCENILDNAADKWVNFIVPKLQKISEIAHYAPDERFTILKYHATHVHEMTKKFRTIDMKKQEEFHEFYKNFVDLKTCASDLLNVADINIKALVESLE